MAEKEVKKTAADQERQKTLNALVKLVHNELGEGHDGAIMRLGEAPPVSGRVQSTGSLLLDQAIGVGGIPEGRVVEIYGPPSGGKSTLCAGIVATAQKNGHICAYIDAENSMDNEYAAAIGVNVNDLLYVQPECGEQALDIADTLARSKSVSVIVIDSVAALLPRAELEGKLDETSRRAALAALMSLAMPKVKNAAAESKCTFIFINQLREKPGTGFGDPRYTPGGNALKFFADIRIEINLGEAIKKGDEIVGRHPGIIIKKNKCGPPMKKATLTIYFGQGIDFIKEILDLGVAQKLIEKAGVWFSYKGTKIGQGEDAAKAWLKANVSACDQIEAQLRQPVKAVEAPKEVPPAE